MSLMLRVSWWGGGGLGLGPSQYTVTQTQRSSRRSSIRRLTAAHYDAGGADERWEWAHRLREVAWSLSFFFFIRLFQTLNVPLYNSSQPLQLPRVSASSLGEETAAHKGRSAPRPTIWRNSNHNKTAFKTEHVHSYTHTLSLLHIIIGP